MGSVGSKGTLGANGDIGVNGDVGGNGVVVGVSGGIGALMGSVHFRHHVTTVAACTSAVT